MEEYTNIKDRERVCALAPVASAPILRLNRESKDGSG
jgi:hypothetical protein